MVQRVVASCSPCAARRQRVGGAPLALYGTQPNKLLLIN